MNRAFSARLTNKPRRPGALPQAEMICAVGAEQDQRLYKSELGTGTDGSRCPILVPPRTSPISSSDAKGGQGQNIETNDRPYSLSRYSCASAKRVPSALMRYYEIKVRPTLLETSRTNHQSWPRKEKSRTTRRMKKSSALL